LNTLSGKNSLQDVPIFYIFIIKFRAEIYFAERDKWGISIDHIEELTIISTCRHFFDFADVDVEELIYPFD